MASKAMMQAIERLERAVTRAEGLARELTEARAQEIEAQLAAGSIDAFNTWEPHVANGKKAMAEQVEQLDTKNVYSETFNIVVMQFYLQSNPKLVEKFLAALLDAEAWRRRWRTSTARCGWGSAC